MSVVMVLFLLALITVIVVAIRYPSASNPAPTALPRYASRGPENLLAERFARGEIDEDEYRRRLSLLRSHH